MLEISGRAVLEQGVVGWWLGAEGCGWWHPGGAGGGRIARERAGSSSRSRAIAYSTGVRERDGKMEWFFILSCVNEFMRYL